MQRLGRLASRGREFMSEDGWSEDALGWFSESAPKANPQYLLRCDSWNGRNFLIQPDLGAKVPDVFDRQILATLQADSSLSMQEIADRVADQIDNRVAAGQCVDPPGRDEVHRGAA